MNLHSAERQACQWGIEVAPPNPTPRDFTAVTLFVHPTWYTYNTPCQITANPRKNTHPKRTRTITPPPQNFPPEPTDPQAFTARFNRAYSKIARGYDWFVKTLPPWRNWITTALPHIQGPTVLEVSFGTGYLLCQYGDRFQTFGIDYNWELACIARDNLQQQHLPVEIQQADVYRLPFLDESFDTVVNTMAFSGYPDGLGALQEIHRVLKSGGRFVLVDVAYPPGENWLGTLAARLWVRFGDILRDMDDLFTQAGFQATSQEVGGFGSVHLYLAQKV